MWFLWGTNWISLSFCSGYVMWFLWGTNWISLSFCSGNITWFLRGTNWISLSFCSGDVTWLLWGTNWISLSFCSGYVMWFLWGTNWISLSFCGGDVIGLESREYGRRDPSRWPRGTLYPQKLALTSPTSGGRSVSIVRLRTQTMQFVCLFVLTALLNEPQINNYILVNKYYSVSYPQFESEQVFFFDCHNKNKILLTRKDTPSPAKLPIHIFFIRLGSNRLPFHSSESKSPRIRWLKSARWEYIVKRISCKC
jgi:hypothetical protein